MSGWLFGWLSGSLSVSLSLSFSVTYLEIYQEALRDLLVADGEPAVRQLRECPKLGIIADGARKVDIRSVEEIYNVLRCGEEKRVKGETKLNAASSRSVEHVKLYL